MQARSVAFKQTRQPLVTGTNDQTTDLKAIVKALETPNLARALKREVLKSVRQNPQLEDFVSAIRRELGMKGFGTESLKAIAEKPQAFEAAVNKALGEYPEARGALSDIEAKVSQILESAPSPVSRSRESRQGSGSTEASRKIGFDLAKPSSTVQTEALAA